MIDPTSGRRKVDPHSQPTEGTGDAARRLGRQCARWPANLGDDDLTAVEPLLAELRPVRFCAGQPLFLEDQPGDSVYVIWTGTVQVSRHGPGGTDHVIGMAGSGDVIGELAVFDPGPRSTSAIAVTDVMAGQIDRAALRRHTIERPDLRHALLTLLARQVKHRHDYRALLEDVPPSSCPTSPGQSQRAR